MNEFFNFRRWWLLALKRWFDNRGRYLLALLTVAGLMLAWYVVYLAANAGSYFEEEVQAVFFFTGLFIAGCIYASVLFNELGSKGKGIAFLTLPASQFEKLLCGVFYGVVVFTVVYTGIFYAINVPAVKISNEVRYQEWLERKALNPEDYKNEQFNPAKVTNVFKYREYRSDDDDDEFNIYFVVWLVYLAVHAFYALGSVYFGKFSFVKTSVTALVLGVIAFLYFLFIVKVFPSGGNLDYWIIELKDNGDPDFIFYYRIPWFIVSADWLLLKFLFPPLFWLIAYVRLKEKQI